MSERARFHSLTKPMKFRRTRVFLKSVGLTYEVGKEKIKCLISYLLYKLKIYKRHTYNDYVVEDMTEKLLAPIAFREPKTFCTRIDSKHVSALVQMRVERHSLINQDYFYVMKNGKRVRKFVVIDSVDSDYKFFGFLDNIGIRVSEEESYHFSKLPVYKIAKEPILPCAFMDKIEEPLKPVECDVYEVDLKGLKSLRWGHSIDSEYCDFEHEPWIVIDRYNRLVEVFRNYLSDLSFRDLLVNRGGEND